MLNDLRSVLPDPHVTIEERLAAATPPTGHVLEAALNRSELSEEDAVGLLQVEGPDLAALLATADRVRSIDVGEEVTYVVNRNINWTNVCFVGCRFCGFARHRKDADAYNHPVENILAKVAEAVGQGAGEICMQAGINPEMDRFAYRDLLTAIRERFPTIHIHAFSPMEIMYGARRARMSYYDYLLMLRDAGLDTIPGTAAEILDDEVREFLSHKKIDVRTWVEIVTTAHSLGIRSSATIMYGHIETPHHIARHIGLIRSLQEQTGGFTEFVPLRFIHEETPLYRDTHLPPPAPLGLLDLRLYAVSRLMLRGCIDNLQTSWVKLGTELAQLSLSSGCNDFGGTLMEESITRSAGGSAGEYLPVREIRTLITAAGRVPVERTTTYGRRDAHAAPTTGDRTGRGRGRRPLSARALLAS